MKMETTRKGLIARVAIAAISLGTLFMVPAQAAVKGINLDFAASYYKSYNHSTGGGAWDDRTVNKDIENSLEGSEFACGDYVSFLTKIQLDDIKDLRDLGEMTLALDYEFDGDSTGSTGVGYSEFGTYKINYPPVVDLVAGENTTDSAMNEIGSNSQESQTAFHNPTPLFSSDNLTGTFSVNNLKAGETVILRTDVKIACKPGSNPTGNILAKITGARLIGANGETLTDPITVNIGANTVPLQNPGEVAQPSLKIVKTVFKDGGSCATASDFAEIPVKGSVTFCYSVTNDSAAPIYNVSAIWDDNATKGSTSDDFYETLTGLTNLDNDGLSDDLAPGATAFVSHFKQYDGQKDTYETNTATVTGYSASTGGTLLTASDTAVVYIDPPLPISISVDKRTNGSDSPTVLKDALITWTYDITNTGNETLTTITLVDDQEGSITCPQDTLGIGASMQCVETGTAGTGWYNNLGTVTGKRLSDVDTVTASDTSSYFGANPSISISKSPETQTIKSAGSATFEIIVTNTGNVPLTGVSVTDTETAGCSKSIGALSVSETSTYTCSLETVTASFINTALAVGYFQTTYVSDVDTASVTFIPPISLSLDKRTNGSDSSTILVGTPITWTFNVTNTGGETLTNIVVNDDKLGDITCPASTLGIGASMQCSETGTAIEDWYYNLGTVTGKRLSDVDTATATDPSSYFGANPKISIVKSTDTPTVKESTSATFKILVTNIGNVPLDTVTVTDTLTADCAKVIGALAVSETSTYTCFKETVTASFINTALVEGIFESTTVSDLDTATITVDYLPKIMVTKTANPTSVPETGGNVLFTYTVTNLGVETFTLTSLMDDKFGNLNGQGTCSVAKEIAVSGSESCTVTMWLSSGNLIPFTNVVTASGVDPEGNPASDTATAGVTFTDVLPDITLLKTANPTVLMLPGGLVTYTFRITNSGSETVTVSSLSDSRFTLPSQCLGLIGETLTPGAYLTCTSSETLTSTTGLPIVNTATATAVDNEGNFDTATASATVNFSWYGRTPGYWKNHPAVWPSPYVGTMTVTSVFFDTGTVPSQLLNNSKFDLNKDAKADTLIAALAYKGGTDLQGAAQILLRAAVAALLNEKYYGSGYPGADSVESLIIQVRTTLLTLNRTAYLTLATTLDMWNNGNEGII